MLFILLLLFIGIILLLFRYSFIRREMNNVTRELERIRAEQTNEYIQINVGHQVVERLAVEINQLIEEKQEVRGSAVRAERELAGMITSMSHDLRTPLTAIIGYVQLLEDPAITPETRAHYLAIVRGRASQLHALIQSFFALSAIQSGEEQLHTEQVNIQEVVQSSVLPYYDLFEEHEKDVHFTLPSGPMIVMGDDVACKRIVENIILNTLQHAGKRVEVIVEETDAQVAFTVKNTMNPRITLDEKRLFDRLYTGDTTRKYHRGLGLPIVKRLMDQMGGRAEAQVGDGIFMIRCTWRK